MNRIEFSVNGVKHSVGCEVRSDTTLLEYLRRHLELRGTKYKCLEAGCGACIVSAVKYPGGPTRGINSCMVMITSCQDWDITTIEKVGNRLEGYHPLQTTLAAKGGSQCGYCSPGMIMNMYSYLNEKPRTMREIEKAIGSNLCRCTGYRPILEAFKMFASDAPKPTNILDIEDFKITCDKSGELCLGSNCELVDWCIVPRQSQVLHIKLSDHRDWYRVETIADVFDIWHTHGTDSYMLVNGNTGKGVYPIVEYPNLIIDISGISELKGYYIDQNLVLGGGTALADVLNIFKALTDYDGFSYLKVLIDHLEKVAHVAVRNLASVAGNLFLKNLHPDFKSDVFLLLETVGAEVTILTGLKQKKILTMQEFLVENMTGKIICNVLLPPLTSENKVVTYKIMPRFQNAHALVHAGFLYKTDIFSTAIDARIVYSGLSATITRAYNTEEYLRGKALFTNETLQGALDVLKEELVFVNSLLDPPVAYKQQVSLGLFYKGLLELSPSYIVNPIYSSGAIKLRDTRPMSKSLQVFETNPTLYPINEPFPKIDGLIQCAGESKYADDIPCLPGELFAAFVLAKVPLGTITKIDPSIALSQHGVIAFYSAKDIPGVNSFVSAPNIFNTHYEELFCDGEVKYYDQPIGVIVAENDNIAKKAAELVHVEYTNLRSPIIDVKMSKKDPTKYSEIVQYKATEIGTDTTSVIISDDTIYSQYPFSMETLACVAHPTEEGIRLIAATQWMDLVQQATSRALNMDENKCVTLKHIGLENGYYFGLFMAYLKLI